MADKSRVNGWLRHQLVYKVVDNDDIYVHHVVFSLVIVPGTYGSRVAVYRNGEKIGQSLRLGGANAVDTAAETISTSLGIPGGHDRLLVVIDNGILWYTEKGTATLIAKV